MAAKKAGEMKNLFGMKYMIIVGAILAAIGLFLAFGPPQLMARTETPEFCSSCHVMEAQYEAWRRQGAHRRQRCIDCHLPHDSLAAYYVWKSIDGMKDVVLFHSGNVPARIEVSERGQGFIQGNCIRCHADTVSRMLDAERDCWDCHRRMQHRLTGSILPM
jgi:cytochrome c nitrite reductase small subunit